MLTPKFKLKQDEENLILQMNVPYIKYEEAQCEINDNVLYFSAKPYYLRLHIPGDVLTEPGPSQYDVDTGDLIVHLKKKNSGQCFEGLDMLTWLLTPQKKRPSPNIEVVTNSRSSFKEEASTILENETEVKDNTDFNSSRISCSNTSSTATTNDDSITGIHIDVSATAESQVLEDEDEEIDWYIDQTVHETENDLQGLDLLGKKTGCGFALRRFNFKDVSSESSFLIDIKDPNSFCLADRRRLRDEQEDVKFDYEHYLADFFDNEMIKEIILCAFPELTGNGTKGGSCPLNEKEMDKLSQLPKKEFLIEPDVLPQIYLGIIDLLFAYAYNYRFTCGEENVEADWTIGKLSSTLSWCDSFSNINDVVLACARRSLCFPLYRSWQLFEKVLDDVRMILRSGKTQILKCLLGILFIFQRSEDRYVLNDLYITDYCVWIQSVPKKCILKLANDLSEVNISKEDVGFKLVELETDALNLMEQKSDDEEEINVLAGKMKDMVKVSNADESDSDDQNDNSSTESSEDESDTDSDSDCRSQEKLNEDETK